MEVRPMESSSNLVLSVWAFKYSFAWLKGSSIVRSPVVIPCILGSFSTKGSISPRFTFVRANTIVCGLMASAGNVINPIDWSPLFKVKFLASKSDLLMSTSPLSLIFHVFSLKTKEEGLKSILTPSLTLITLAESLAPYCDCSEKVLMLMEEISFDDLILISLFGKKRLSLKTKELVLDNTLKLSASPLACMAKSYTDSFL